MMRYWSLVGGTHEPSTFFAAAEEAAKAVGVQRKLLLHKLKNPKANYMDFK